MRGAKAVTCRPVDVVDERKLRVAMVRLGLSEDEVAKRVGMSSHGFNSQCAYPSPGWRERVERALALEPGALKFT